MTTLISDVDVLLAAELMVLFIVFSDQFVFSGRFLANLPALPSRARASKGLASRANSGRVYAFSLKKEEESPKKKKGEPLFLTVEKSCLQNQRPIRRTVVSTDRIAA